jgi:PE-PPE domain
MTTQEPSRSSFTPTLGRNPVHGNDDLVIYGYSQGAVIANREKKELAKQYPAGTEAPDIDFVLSGDLNVPNGGLVARFPGLYIPILDWSFNGPEPTDTKFDTVVITRQYDGFADFPLYPLNVIADMNAVLGFLCVHDYNFDVSLPADPTKSKYYQGTHGDTSYYFFDTPDLPLFGPLRSLGVPEPVIDVVEPFFRDIVELGYDRSIKPWEPAPARLIPTLDQATVAGDTAQLGIFLQTTSKDTASKTDQTSTDMPTSKKDDTATAQQELAPEPKAVNAPKHSATASRSESAKPSMRSITPRPVVRGSLKALEKSRDLPHRRNGAEPTTHPASTGDKAATTRSNSSGGDSSGGDAGES